MNNFINRDYDRFSPERIINEHLTTDRRVLIFGESGIGKSTLATQLMLQLQSRGRHVSLLDADPGSPAFGIPGAICLTDPYLTGKSLTGKSLAGKRLMDQGLTTEGQLSWKIRDFEALCSLDVGRFRLPLAAGVRTLLARVPQRNTETLIIDAPGVTRGVAGAELLQELITATHADLVLILVRKGQPPPLINELCACRAERVFISAHDQALRPDKGSRRRERTQHWQTYLEHATEQVHCLDHLLLLGTPPPISEPTAWVGRQIALLDKKRTLAMGQVVSLENNILRILTPANNTFKNAQQLLIRDAVQTSRYGLHTAPPIRPQTQAARPVTDVIAPTVNDALVDRLSIDSQSPPVVMRIDPVDVILINGVFGDPLLLTRFRHEKRSLLFDLGYQGQLPARIAHQISDVFISHTHIDHITGFLWLLRSRIGYYPPCRLFGPPGLAQNIAGMISGILWDRISDKAPSFDIFELHGQRLRRWQITAGCAISNELPEQVVRDGLIWQDASFCVRAVTLDHTPRDDQASHRQPYTPVLAFAFEPANQIKVRKDQLTALNLTPGPWLQQLKEHVLNGELNALIQLADRSVSVAYLADSILMKSTGQKLAYATDFADIPDNHAKLTELAKNAHTLFCEASFVNADTAQASRTGHLTTQACGDIGSKAAVKHLVPFHFSKRYQGHAGRSYQEVSRVCSRTIVPGP